MSYITGNTIRKLREKKKLTQKELADKISVSDKTVSKWETSRGLPDIGIIEDLAAALGTSVTDLLTGDYCNNNNVSANMKKEMFYVCPVCGNIIASTGEGSYSCCGVKLTFLEPEAEIDENHRFSIETIENEYFISMEHEMQKNHYISFMAFVTSDSIEIKKLYPEQSIAVRFLKKGHGILYIYCNRHGLFKKTI